MMVRKLPWKQVPEEGAKVSKSKNDTASKSTELRSQESTGEPSRTKKYPDDWNYRLTESNFIATAKSFTEDMHKEAYRKLVERQTRAAERSSTIDELLEQPLERQAMPLISPVKKPLPKPLNSEMARMKYPVAKVEVKTEAVAVEPNANEIATKEEDLTKSPAVKPDLETTHVQSSVPSAPLPQPSVTKPTAAALARKRKREQAQKAEPQFLTLI